MSITVIRDGEVFTGAEHEELSPTQTLQDDSGNDSFSATATGTARDLVFYFAKHTWTVVITGSPTAVDVDFEGSIDGTSYFVLDSYTSTSDTMRHVVNKAVRYVRAVLNTLTGGSSPTVTVKHVSLR